MHIALTPLLCFWAFPQVERAHAHWHFRAQGQAPALFYHGAYGFWGIENQSTYLGERLWSLRYASHPFNLSILKVQFHLQSSLGQLSKEGWRFAFTTWSPLGLAEFSLTLKAWGIRWRTGRVNASPEATRHLPPALMMHDERRNTFIQYPPSPEKTPSRSRPLRPPSKLPKNRFQPLAPEATGASSYQPHTSPPILKLKEKFAFSEPKSSQHENHTLEPQNPCSHATLLSCPLQATEDRRPFLLAPPALPFNLSREPSPWSLNVSTMSVLDSVVSLSDGSPILRCGPQKTELPPFIPGEATHNNPFEFHEIQKRSRGQRDNQSQPVRAELTLDSINPQFLMELLKTHGIDLIMHPWSHMLESYLRLLKAMKAFEFNELEVNRSVRWILQGVLGEEASLKAYFFGRAHPWMKENFKHMGVIFASMDRSPLTELKASSLLSLKQLSQWRDHSAYQQATLWFYFLSWQAPMALQKGTEALGQWGASRPQAIKGMELELFPAQEPWSWKRIHAIFQQAMERFQAALVRIERSQVEALGLGQIFEAQQSAHQTLMKLGESYEMQRNFRLPSLDKSFAFTQAAYAHSVEALTLLNLESCALISNFLQYLSTMGISHHDLALRLWVAKAPAFEWLLANQTAWNEALRAWESHQKVALDGNLKPLETLSNLKGCTLWISQLRGLQSAEEAVQWHPVSEREWLKSQGLSAPLRAHQALMRQLEVLRHGWKDFLAYGEFQALFLGAATSKPSKTFNPCKAESKGLRNHRASVMEWDERFDDFFMRKHKMFNLKIWGEPKPQSELKRSLTGPNASPQTSPPKVKFSQSRADSLNPSRKHWGFYQRESRLR